MRLSKLIRVRKEAILQEFEDFARTHTSPGTSMDVEALRDHAAEMLTAMATDLEQTQTDSEREIKGKGDAVVDPELPRTAAEDHGLARAERGFTMEETFAEYRALRASVMRHYVAAGEHDRTSDVEEVIRFHEAIDQALAESITEYARAIHQYRDMFLAVLGHDLRSPLNAVSNASAVLSEYAELSERDGKLAKTIAHSAKAMSRLVDDLLEYTSGELGGGITLRRAATDLEEIGKDVVREVRVSRPGIEIRLQTEGDLVGDWDPGRIRQRCRISSPTRRDMRAPVRRCGWPSSATKMLAK